MTWTAPATAVTGNTLTAAFWNAQVRDNMLESAAATAAAAGDLVYADAANSMGSRVAHSGTGKMLVSDASNGLAWRQPAEDVNYGNGSTSQSDTDTSYVSEWGLAGGGGPFALPSVTVTTGTAAIIVVSCRAASNNTAGQSVVLTYSISGATTVAAADAASGTFQSDSANHFSSIVSVRFQAVTAGSNTFQMEAKVGGGTGTIDRPRILVIPL